MKQTSRKGKARNPHSYVTKTVEYTDLFDGPMLNAVAYLMGINKRWLIESVVHMISVDSFDSFSMAAGRCLLMMFQDYTDKVEVKRLFNRLKEQENNYKGIWLTLINHQALFRLLREVLLLPNEREGKGECYASYEALLKAILIENSIELQRERDILGKIKGEAELRDAMILMQQDILSLDRFGENKKELEKVQLLKYLALCNFGKSNSLVGDAIKRVVNRHGFESEFQYVILADLPLGVYHDNKGFKEGLIYLRKEDFSRTNTTNIWNQFVSFVADKSIDVWDTERMKDIFNEQEVLDNTCFRKYPVLKMSEEEYLIVSQTYYSHLFYDCFWWSVKDELRSVLPDEAVSNLLTKDFSEKVLFCRLVMNMIGDRRIRIYNEHCFEDCQPSPDMAIKTRRHLYFFEYKDMRVRKKVADGGDMTLLMGFIDDRLNKEKGATGGNKGLPQLVCNMEDFFLGKQPWGQNMPKQNIIVHPIIVVNNRMFGVRGINYLMQQKMRKRILENDVLKNHSGMIDDLQVLDYDILVLVVAHAYKHFGYFQRFLSLYQAHVNTALGINRYDSFRHFSMNTWEQEKTAEGMKRFEYCYKQVVKSMAIRAILGGKAN